MQDAEPPHGDSRAPRERVLDAALALGVSEGLEAVTTRAVAKAARVQVPTIYNLFGDKEGMLAAMLEHGIARYVDGKKNVPVHPDAVEAIRQAWDKHVGWGLENPLLFSMMTANASGPSAVEGMKAFRAMVRRVAESGRLATSEELAVATLRACCVGTVVSILSDEPEDRAAVSRSAREAALAAITTDRPSEPVPDFRCSAASLRARLDDIAGLTRGERILLDELLARIATAGTGVPQEGAADGRA